MIVVDALFGGGAERHVIDLASGLRGHGCDVEIACSAFGCSTESLSDLDVPVHELVGRLVKRRVSLRYAHRLRRLIAAAGYDIVHAHIYASEAAATVAVIGTPVPLVLTEHTEAPWRGIAARMVSRLVYRRAAAIIVVSRAIAELLARDYGVDHGRMHRVLPVGRPRDPAPNEGTPLLALPTGRLVGCIARLQPEKGVDVLVRAFRQVSTELPDVHLVVVGEGPHRPALTRLADTLGIGRIVHFLGYRDDVPLLLDRLDVLAVPSRSDGSPLVIHEALQTGTPVVGSCVGGIPDRLADGSAGVLVPPGDDRALARAIRDLLVDEGARRRLIAAGLRRASTHTYASMVSDVCRVYESVRSASPALDAD